MKFLLFAEGKTEKLGVAPFVKRWLDAQDLPKRVGVFPVPFEGNTNFVTEAPKKARTRLTAPDADEIIAIIGLLDVLRLPPAYDEGNSAAEKCEFARTKIEKEVGQERFLQFFAVHEGEAWLLSSPEVFPRPVQERLAKLSTSPERVNFDKPPAKQIGSAYHRGTGKRYKKAVHGPMLFAKLDPDTAAGKCPHLRGMLEKMLDLARKAL